MGHARHGRRGRPRTQQLEHLDCSKRSKFNERARLEFRAETFNTFNHTQFTNPQHELTSGNFGQFTGTYDPRIFQFGLKFLF